ncbi:uncharacterized protein LOC100837044 [Brachypodium distachyon]|uniref:Uncharacterized protein n=1 Tax=Brachypodium distachyon TaxID=15368 RepID=A0A2K2CGD4_BRADI|nr:uncharacterized protein LOC100837044 [Brachypodium distachyon]PNT61077.1 hypothetical protein BRADI_5g10104v3 [Brachypodium distachyon]|eukprot:XP_024311485.1 uncharacterized protein LOC100837044 [Brachypodium distachyon]
MRPLHCRLAARLSSVLAVSSYVLAGSKAPPAAAAHLLYDLANSYEQFVRKVEKVGAINHVRAVEAQKETSGRRRWREAESHGCTWLLSPGSLEPNCPVMAPPEICPWQQLGKDDDELLEPDVDAGLDANRHDERSIEPLHATRFL